MIEKWLTALGYAIGKGIAAAIIEDLRTPKPAEDEEVTDEDRAKADNLNDFLAGHLDGLQAPPHGDTGPNDSAPNVAEDDGPRMA